MNDFLSRVIRPILTLAVAGSMALVRADDIPVVPGQSVVIRKIQPVDSRLVRGFTHSPVDGRIDTRYATGSVGEWLGASGIPAVNYRDYNGNNGLHITFAKTPVDVVQIRGGWRGAVFADSDSLLRPTTPPLFTLDRAAPIHSESLADSPELSKLSFFFADGNERPLADLSIFRVTRGAEVQPEQQVKPWRVGGDLAQPEWLQVDLARRFPAANSLHALAEDGDGTLTLEANATAHLITPVLDADTGIASVVLTFTVSELAVATPLTVQVHDVLDPRRATMTVRIRVPGPGTYRVTLDGPDQVFLPDPSTWAQAPRLEGPIVPPAQLWLSITSDATIQMTDVAVAPQRVPRETALAEAGAWRLFLLRGMFSSMSENRPWMLLKDERTPEDREIIREQIKAKRHIRKYEMSLIELLETAEIAHLLLPGDPVASQYHSWLYQNVDRRKPKPPPQVALAEGTPEWASLIRSNWIEQAHIAEWWLDNRLVPNGEIGGGIGDDTDMAQVWQCLPMIDNGPLGQRLLQQSAQLADLCIEYKLEEGINRKSTDALHAYEDGINQLALNAWWFYGDPVHMERAMISARSVIHLMHETKDGRLHFPSDRVGITEARIGYDKPPAATPGNFSWSPQRLLLQPLYVVSWYNRNPEALGRFSQWGDSWMSYQKPGAFVDKVDIPTGTPIAASKLPPGSNISPLEEFLALYHVTGDEKWHAAYKMGIGSGKYAGIQAQYGRMPHALVAWEGDIAADMLTRCTSPESGYAGFYIHKDRALLTHWLTESADWFQRYRYIHTAGEQKTDRVITHNATTAISAYLGDAPNRNRWLNFTAVSYEGLRGEDFAALVWEAGRDRLRVAIYNFRDEPMAGTMRVWRLDHGHYTVRQGIDADDDGQLDGDAPGTRHELQRYSPISLELPPRQVTVIDIRQMDKLDDITTRADLAMSPLDTTYADGVLTVNVHNIGSQAATDIRVELRRGDTIVAERLIATLEAPNDLIPRITTIRFDDAKPGDVVVVDPANTVPEIAEHNNQITCPTP